MNDSWNRTSRDVAWAAQTELELHTSIQDGEEPLLITLDSDVSLKTPEHVHERRQSRVVIRSRVQ